MRKLNFKTFIFFAVLLLVPAAFADAQGMQERPNIQPRRLFEQLGLSREQIQQIRRINQERQPLMREAQDNMRDATRALDQAIYAETVSEETVQARLKDVQEVQAVIVRVRATTELEIRKVLTAAQLAKFIKLREEAMREREQRRMENEDRPNQPRNNQNLQQRPNKRPGF